MKPSVNPEAPRATHHQGKTPKGSEEADIQKLDQRKQGDSSREGNAPKPPPPFPVKKRARKIKLQDKEYQRFVQMLKEVKINVSAHELFTGIPKYAKFFKTMLSNKEDVAEEEMVKLSAKCSSLFKKDISLPRN